MPTYTLDRFRQATLMAEGAVVKAETEEEAISKARRMFKEPSCRLDYFKVASVTLDKTQP